jgi:predicted O-linked N-acetylglucosamine transferase (SPINDLY family)
MFNWLKKTIPPQKAPSAAISAATANGSSTPSSLPDECATYKNQGDKYFNEGKLEEAAASYRQAIAINPNYAEAYNNLGNVLREQGFHQEAEHSLKQAILIKPGLANAYCNLGSLLFEQGKMDEAIENFNKALELKPDVEIIYRDLSYALIQTGRHETAKRVIAKGIALNPGFADFHFFLGNMHWQEHELDEAVACYQRALTIQADYVEVFLNLGKVFQAQEKLSEAINCFSKALEIKPDMAYTHYDLGMAFQKQGALDKATDCYRKVLMLKPDFAEAYVILGIILKEQGEAGEAMMCYGRALELKPDLIEAHNNLGGIFKDRGMLDEAISCYQKALVNKPDSADVHYNLGVTFHELFRLDEAELSFRRALQNKLDYAEAYNNLGSTLQLLGRRDEAEVCCRKALQIKPDYAEAHSNLGVILENLCRLDEAMASLRQALEIKPDFADAHSNLIFAMDLSDTVNLSELHGERKKWDEVHAIHLRQDTHHSNSRSSARRLRVGYVSADLREHSAPKVFGGMLIRYDRSQFDVFAYSNLKGKADRFTDLFKQNVTAWRNIGGLSDDAVAKMIREDRIDILIDLSGHSAGNRLLAFARKPAPIQITAWGYATGTGMRAMDVFFTDPVMVPPHEKQYFSEEIRYLPNVVGAFFIDPFPDVNELPALSDGVITFGSLNRLAKISDKTYRAWTEVLLAVPRSRLILKTVELDDATVRERVIEHFTKAGVVAERIIMLGKTSWNEHVQAYNQIDIALDPFPHGGGVTTLEGVMMGVPAITLRWPTTVGRLSASIMTTLGLTDWIAETEEQYVALAVQKAGDLQSLAVLRQQLRGIFTSSVIGDQAAYTQAVEQEYRKLWQEWCARQQVQS